MSFISGHTRPRCHATHRGPSLIYMPSLTSCRRRSSHLSRWSPPAGKKRCYASGSWPVAPSIERYELRRWPTLSRASPEWLWFGDICPYTAHICVQLSATVPGLMWSSPCWNYEYPLRNVLPLPVSTSMLKYFPRVTAARVMIHIEWLTFA